MRLIDALKLQDDNYQKRKQIRIYKGQDYANNDDCLQNFKKMSQILSILNIDITKSYGICLIYAVLKIDRLCNLIFRKKTFDPQNESIEDTLNDLQNYIDKTRECLIDEKIRQT